jgi:tetratricopeptide (TPR) repeat protein
MKVRLVVAALVVTACGGSSGKGKEAAAPAAAVPAAAAPAAEPAPAPAPAPAPESEDITITSKSPEAIEHFKKGRELVDNLRSAESVEHFKKALELDPDFALAAAYLGGATPGNEGFALVDRSVGLAREVPDPERRFIEAQKALNDGDTRKASELLRQVVAAKPKDWRAQLLLAQLDFGEERWDDVVTAARKALEVSPSNPQPYNLIAYAGAYSGRWEDAIAAAEKQVELLPDEPNPLDTLGEVLLAAGRLDAAQAAFEKAVEKAPSFHLALVGVAETQMYKADWKAGYATLKRAREAAPRPEDKIGVDVTEAWALAGQGKLADAMKLGAAAEKLAESEGRPVPHTFAALNRGLLLAMAGKPADALKLVDVAYARAAKAELAAPIMRAVTILGEQVRLLAAWKAKKPAAADKAYAALEVAVRQRELTRADRSLLDWAQGVVAWTRGDAGGAFEAMKRCSQLDYTCRFMAVQTQRASGDRAGAKTSLDALKSSPRRANDYVYFWSGAR